MLRILIHYILYKIFSRHKRGHGIHSPFVYTFICKVLSNDKPDRELEMTRKWCRQIRKRMLPATKTTAGAGTRRSLHISSLRASKIGVKCKFGEMLYRLAGFVKPAQIIELGTGSGLSAGFLSKGAPEALVYSVEIDSSRMDFARESLALLDLKNIHLVKGNFDDFLEGLGNIPSPFLVFIDGNHRLEPVMRYFNFFAGKADPNSIVVLDDIRWSPEMEIAWRKIKEDPRVSITVDLFFMGIVFFHPGIARQDFLINF